VEQELNTEKDSVPCHKEQKQSTDQAGRVFGHRKTSRDEATKSERGLQSPRHSGHYAFNISIKFISK
jgi:hypothetical protein